MMEQGSVSCPSCFEVFSISLPFPEERPAELDYDCEICCRPMFIFVSSEGEAEARSLDDFA